MNAKQSKKLRKQALKIAVENNLQYVDYKLNPVQKFYTDMAGKIHSFTMYAVKMNMCERKVYKELKKNFKCNSLNIATKMSQN